MKTPTYVISSDQLSSDLAGETVLLHLKTGLYFGLDEVGTCIWRLLRTPQTVAEIRDAIMATFDVEAERCERDLRALLDQLVAHQLVDVGERAE